jgi:hypothetical protein
LKEKSDERKSVNPENSSPSDGSCDRHPGSEKPDYVQGTFFDKSGAEGGT